MPEYQMPGKELPSYEGLDEFTQGYIEALFFTNAGPDDEEMSGKGFYDLAPEALTKIIDDCRKFQIENRLTLSPDWAFQTGRNMLDAGRDFWFTRQRHGVGFWDGDWPEPYATVLDNASKKFNEVWPYVGDDGKVYI